MPGLNGVETIRRARGFLPGLPCFLLTGYMSALAEPQSMTTFTAIRKPVRASDLAELINAGIAASYSR